MSDFDDEEGPDEGELDLRPLAERVADGLEKAKEEFAKPLSDLLPPQVAARFADFKLADREVVVTPFVCDAGHKHRQVVLAEIFREAAEGETPAEPALTLDQAIEKVTAEAAIVPDGTLGIANESGVEGPGLMPFPDGSIRRVFIVNAAYDTEASAKLADAIASIRALKQEEAAKAGGPSLEM